MIAIPILFAIWVGRTDGVGFSVMTGKVVGCAPAKSCSAASAIGTLQYHNRGFMAGDLAFGQPTERRDDHAISHLRPPRGRTVDQDLSTASRTWYRVSFEMLAIGDIPDVYALKRRDSGGAQQIYVYSN